MTKDLLFRARASITIAVNRMVNTGQHDHAISNVVSQEAVVAAELNSQRQVAALLRFLLFSLCIRLWCISFETAAFA